jgi:hypothetical protein
MAYTGITGFVQGSSPNLDQGVICGSNLDLSGVLPSGQTGNCFSTDGQLWIGSTAVSTGGTHAKVGNITNTDGSITVSNMSGEIRLTGTAQGFQPNAVLQLFDDFLSQNGTGSSSPGQLLWNKRTINSGTTTSANHPGIVQLQNADSSGINLDDNLVGNIILGGGVLTNSFNFSLVTLSAAGNRYTTTIGMTDDLNGEAIVNGVYFTYSDNVNSGKWVINCTSASVTTSVNTSIAADTLFHTYTFVVNAAGTSVSFYIDNQFVGSAITTNIPTTAINPYLMNVRSSGASPLSEVDLFWLTINLTNPRPGPTAGAIPANNRLIEAYTATAISYQVLGTDAIIGVTSTAAARTITMPLAPTVGQIWTIKDESGGAAAFNITVAGNGWLIDGAATFLINTNYGSVDLYFSGLGFFIV